MLEKINQSSWIQIQVDTIAQEMESSSICQKKYRLLSQKLDNTWDTLHAKTADVFAKKQAEGLTEQMVHLYGRLEELVAEEKISAIQVESHSLRNGRISRKAIDKLKKDISKFENDHQTSIDNRRILADAKRALFEAKTKLQGTEMKNNFENRVEYSNFPVQEELYPGEMEDLMDIACDIYHGNTKRAKMHFATLPEAHKYQVTMHLQDLGGKFGEDTLKTVQALFMTVYKLVGHSEQCPTHDQIHEFFQGLKQFL